MLKIADLILLKGGVLVRWSTCLLYISESVYDVGAIAIILRFLIRENQIKSGKNQGKIREFDCWIEL